MPKAVRCAVELVPFGIKPIVIHCFFEEVPFVMLRRFAR